MKKNCSNESENAPDCIDFGLFFKKISAIQMHMLLKVFGFQLQVKTEFSTYFFSAANQYRRFIVLKKNTSGQRAFNMLGLQL